jgi:hypothetical protein
MTYALSVLALAFLNVIQAQITRPDFSGHWVMVSPVPGQEQLIAQDGDVLTIATPGVETAPAATFRLDGTETRNSLGDAGLSVARARWQGQRLEITSSMTIPDGTSLAQTLIWWLDPRGQLLIEVRNAGQDPRTMIYRRR